MIQVCHGLQAAHEGVSLKTADMTDEQQNKIVHRDLKPSNIFLVPTLSEERVKIIDFGVDYLWITLFVCIYLRQG